MRTAGLSEAARSGGGRAQRLSAVVRGAVQGVGFRPFVHRLATELGLKGWVSNSAQGLFLEVEGSRSVLEQFLLRLEAERPPHSYIQSLESSWLDSIGYVGFEIKASRVGGPKTTLVLPDIATCQECVREIFDPSDRRFGYPFTNCTHCGPRFSIIESLPYDRGNTSMKAFTMCPRCQTEYDDPKNRRFHAQPNACPECGPQLELWDEHGRPVPVEGRALSGPEPTSVDPIEPRLVDRLGRLGNGKLLIRAAEALRNGAIVGLKGLGGFHLLASADQDNTVRCLRERKHREEKPFAVMFPTLAAARESCELSALEQRLLCSAEAPIVLLRRSASHRGHMRVSELVAPGNPWLGVLLPYTPLHYLLMALLDFPVVATSGNLSDEPICINEKEAVQRLGGIADLFLVHNRPIVRHVDDSIGQIILDRELVLRRARGYAPLPVGVGGLGRAGRTEAPLAEECSEPIILAVGSHLKNTVGISIGSQAFLSQHIGDLETELAASAFEHAVRDLRNLYEATPAVVAADRHPDYVSTRFARSLAGPVSGPEEPVPGGSPRLVEVQHHLAHVLACMAENELEPPVLGVAWDGTGYGLDGTVWGGEFILVRADGWDRVAHLRPFPLPGGEQAIREPRRSALGLLYEHFGAAAFSRSSLAPLQAFSSSDLSAIQVMLARGLNSPLTSSVGRLFDAVAGLSGLRQIARFEAQAAMDLEFACGPVPAEEAYRFNLIPGPGIGKDQEMLGSKGPGVGLRPSLIVDWAPMLAALLADLEREVPTDRICARFHRGLAEAIVSVAGQIGQSRVALSGGCFQNRTLTEQTVRLLEEAAFRPYWHQRVPPNDGGIALGQIVAARLFQG